MRTAPSSAELPDALIAPDGQRIADHLRVAGSWYVFSVRGLRSVPGWDPAVVGRGLDHQTYLSDVDGNWSASGGKAVFGEWKAEIHVADAPIPFEPSLALVCGLDQGGTDAGGTPCMVPMQLNDFGQLVLWEATIPRAEESVGIQSFAVEWCMGRLLREFGLPYGMTLRDLQLYFYGDPAGKQKAVSGKGMARREIKSCWDIWYSGDEIPAGTDQRGNPVMIKRPGTGYRVIPGEVLYRKRLEIIKARLQATTPDGYPALICCPTAVQVIDAFSGGFGFAQHSDGTYDQNPKNNKYKDIISSISYATSKLFESGAKEPARVKPQQAWKSVTSGYR